MFHPLAFDCKGLMKIRSHLLVYTFNNVSIFLYCLFTANTIFLHNINLSYPHYWMKNHIDHKSQTNFLNRIAELIIIIMT